MAKQIKIQEAAGKKMTPKGLGILNCFQGFKGKIGEADPEIAKEAIKQFPEFAKSMREAHSELQETLKEVVGASSKSLQSCYDGNGELRRAYIERAKECDASSEDSKYYMNLAQGTVDADARKHTEQNEFLKDIAEKGLAAVVAVGCILALALHGRIDLKLPEQLEDAAA